MSGFGTHTTTSIDTLLSDDPPTGHVMHVFLCSLIYKSTSESVDCAPVISGWITEDSVNKTIVIDSEDILPFAYFQIVAQ